MRLALIKRKKAAEAEKKAKEEKTPQGRLKLRRAKRAAEKRAKERKAHPSPRKATTAKPRRAASPSPGHVAA